MHVAPPPTHTNTPSSFNFHLHVTFVVTMEAMSTIQPQLLREFGWTGDPWGSRTFHLKSLHLDVVLHEIHWCVGDVMSNITWKKINWSLKTCNNFWQKWNELYYYNFSLAGGQNGYSNISTDTVSIKVSRVSEMSHIHAVCVFKWTAGLSLHTFHLYLSLGRTMT